MQSLIFSLDGRTEFVDKIITLYNDDTTVETNSDLGEVHINDLFVGSIRIDKFSDGEVSTNYMESVRGSRVFLVCSTNNSENILTLFLAIDAAKRASAAEVVAVIPYFGYARQDKKDGMRGAIGARVIAELLQSVDVDRVITVDLHAEQIQGFFRIPVDHIESKYIFVPYVRELLNQKKVKDLVLCSPDAGGVKRVDAFFKALSRDYANVSFAHLNKRRDKPNSIASMELIGEVESKDVIIIDDIVDTAGTLCQASNIISDAGAKSIRAIVTHAVLSGSAFENLYDSKITELVISDTLSLPPIPKKEESVYGAGKITKVSCTKGLSKLIRAVNRQVSADPLVEKTIE